MPSYVALAQQVENAVSDADVQRRHATLQTSAEYVIDRWSKTLPDQRGPLEDLLLAVVEKTDVATRASIATRLSVLRRAPPRVVVRLACDVIGVARPILEGARALDDELLLKICETASAEHLHLVAARAGLRPPVTDVLVSRADPKTLDTLLRNEQARFSAEGFEDLYRRAQVAEPVTLRLAARAGDLPPGLHERLVALADLRVRRSVKEDLGAEAGAWVNEVLPALLASYAAVAGTDATRLLAISDAFIADRFAGRTVPFEQIARWASRNLSEDVIAGLAWNARIPSGLCGAAHAASGHLPLLMIARGLEFDWNSFKAVLQHKMRREPDYTTLQTAFGEYEAFSAATARRVVRLAAMRQGATAFLI